MSATEINRVMKAFTDEQAKTIFLTLVLTGIRRGELQALRWRDVDLVENVLRVDRLQDRAGHPLDRTLPHSRGGALATPPSLATSRAMTSACSATPSGERSTGSTSSRSSSAMRSTEAGITDYVRPFHDLRHTSLTQEAASGSTRLALMARAGHTDMRVTRSYLHLAGIVFRDEAEALERRLGLGVRTFYPTFYPHERNLS